MFKKLYLIFILFVFNNAYSNDLCDLLLNDDFTPMDFVVYVLTWVRTFEPSISFCVFNILSLFDYVFHNIYYLNCNQLF